MHLGTRCSEMIYISFEKVHDILFSPRFLKIHVLTIKDNCREKYEGNRKKENLSVPGQNVKTRTSGVAVFSKTFYLLHQQK